MEKDKKLMLEAQMRDSTFLMIHEIMINDLILLLLMLAISLLI